MVRAGQVATPLGTFPAPGIPEGEGAIVCLRPQGVRFRAPGFCLPGRVTSRRFLGEVDLVQVAVQGLDRPLQARTRGGYRAGEGEYVGVDVDRDEVLVFAASAS